MKEHVGLCHMCNKDIFCLDGFLNGMVDDEGRLTCFDCSNLKKGNRLESGGEM
jgi:hypothetical protein